MLHTKRSGKVRFMAPARLRFMALPCCQMAGTSRKSGRVQEFLNNGDAVRIHSPDPTSLAGETRAVGWQKHPQLLEPTEHNHLLVIGYYLNKDKCQGSKVSG